MDDGQDDELEEAPALVAPLRPEELDRLQALDARARAAWMLEDVARHEEAWALENSQGWVIFEVANAPAGSKPWALPLWPRQELAALAARDASEQPRRLTLDTLLEDLLPDVMDRGWNVLACPNKDGGAVEPADAFADSLADAWTALAEEEGV
jgi:hypothetical protein